MLSRDGELGPRRVVLAQAADALEEAAARFVVEIFRGKVLLRQGEAGEDLVPESIIGK